MSASSSTYVTVTGLTELNQMIASIPQVFDKAFQDAGTKYAKIVYDQAYKRCPVKTGYLRSTIGQQVTPKEIRIFANAKYAAAVHNGGRGRPGRPFLGAPAKENTPQLLKDIDTTFGTYIKSKSTGK